jgi:hypothetical protein
VQGLSVLAIVARGRKAAATRRKTPGLFVFEQQTFEGSELLRRGICGHGPACQPAPAAQI